jgi:16S rRNA (guanine527-N7)-methyltransferase
LDSLAQTLREGCETLQVATGPQQQQQLLAYLQLLERWNGVYNLTAVRDPREMVIRHLLDSLSVLPHLPAGALLDIGAGAGLPGIPLAIADPRRPITLLDSNGKKTRFMFQAASELGLTHCRIIRARVEHWQAPMLAATVISRAFASLPDMIDTCGHLLAPKGILLAMKGQYPAEELAAVADRADIIDVQTLTVPGLAEDRCLVSLRPHAQ